MRDAFYLEGENINMGIRTHNGVVPMLIEGPLKIGVLDQSDQPGRELHIDFTPGFQTLGLQDQDREFKNYLQDLERNIANLPEGEPNRAGMLIVQQIAEQLLPHIQNGDLELHETIVVEMGRDYSSDSLMNLLGQ